MKTRILILLIGLIPLSLSAEIINVPNDYETIQRAINSARDSDTVLVQTGTYVGNISFCGKDIVVGSLMLTMGDEAYIDSTIIEGAQNCSVVQFIQRESSNARLIGFTIQNGIGTHLNDRFTGGGILIVQSDVVIEHCRIYDNHVVTDSDIPSFGGGIACYGYANPTIRNCEIYENSSDGYGGGISIELMSNPILENVIIKDNSAYGGAGITIFNNCNVTISHSVISENIAEDFGGGIFAERTSQVDLLNVTIVGNSCSSVGGGILLNLLVQLNAVNSIFWDNYQEELSHWDGSDVSLSYCDIEDGEDGIDTNSSEIDWSEGNIDNDPLFTNPGESDYHLTAHSPCVDTGDPDSPNDPDSTRADMGAFYFNQPENVISPYDSKFPCDFSMTAFPNPFNSTTTISYTLPSASQVSLKLFDLCGREVKTLTDGYIEAGQHSVSLSGNGLSSGVYLVKMEARGSEFVRKALLVR